MKMRPAHSRHPKSATRISTALLFGALALTTVVDGLEVSLMATAAPVPEMRLTRGQRAMCDECGVVTAVRRLAQWDSEWSPAADIQHELTVRMRDGATRTFIEASSVRWRSGERIILIEGAGQSSN